MLDYVEISYSVEIKEVEISNLGITKLLIQELGVDLLKR